MEYQEFLKKKMARPSISGFEVHQEDINPMLFDFQNAIVRWAIRLGKAAIFASVGLGKTFMQIEWARLIMNHSQGSVLILAPLAVSQQTIREAAKLGVIVRFAKDASDVTGTGIYISNYERLDKMPTHVFSGVVLDESSILKGADSKTRLALISAFSGTAYKLACSATPAPNDYIEFGAHGEFLNIMPSNEMLARWFSHDAGKTQNWKLKGWGAKDFWRWITSWAVCISKPRDLGDAYHMQGYDLPALHINYEWVGTSDETIQRAWREGKLIAGANASATDIHKVKRESIELRLNRAMEIVQSIPSDEPILIWCETNYEADALIDAFKPLGAVEVRGNESPEKKEEKLLGFTDGEIRILITKPSIAGMGLNWQHCRHAIFFSPSFSFEGEYQAIGRNYRFGQEREVFVYMIVSETESNIADIVARKRADFEAMQKKMNSAMKQYGLFRDDKRMELTVAKNNAVQGKHFTLFMGDCVQEIKQIADESIHFSIYSPPFASLYVYSENEADMGNCADDAEFIEHYGNYLVPEIYRITKPGRLSAVHCMDLPSFKGKDGFVGLKDFSGDIIKAHQDAGWIYHCRITIWKNPVVEMQRTKAVGLLHKQFVKDSTMSRVGTPDYLLVFRKDGDNPEPVTKQGLSVDDYIGEDAPPLRFDTTPSIDIWQKYASPVWMDIRQTNTLNVEVARSAEDEKHLAPLQLDVIERAIQLWTNEGDTVFSPFAGIGSEPYSAIKMKRYGIGIELKEAYFKWAVKNCQEAERQVSQKTLFDLLDEQAGD